MSVVEYLSDEPSFAHYAAHCFKRGLEELYWPDDRDPTSGGEHVIMAMSGMSPAGFATFYDVGNSRLWLDLVFVEPDLRGKGIGTELVRRVTDYAGTQGLRRIYFGTGITNTAMQRVACKAGFGATSKTFQYTLAKAAE